MSDQIESMAQATADADDVSRAVLALVAEADLVRQADGYTVAVWYRPSLRAPERATVEVYYGAQAIDALDVPASVAMDVWRHAAAYSVPYAEVLTAA